MPAATAVGLKEYLTLLSKPILPSVAVVLLRLRALAWAVVRVIDPDTGEPVGSDCKQDAFLFHQQAKICMLPGRHCK